MVVGYHGMVARAIFQKKVRFMYETWSIKGLGDSLCHDTKHLEYNTRKYGVWHQLEADILPCM